MDCLYKSVNNAGNSMKLCANREHIPYHAGIQKLC